MRKIIVTKYVSDDGEEFDSEVMCIRHEHVSSLCNEVKVYYNEEHGIHAPSVNEIVEYIVDNFHLTRISLGENA